MPLCFYHGFWLRYIYHPPYSGGTLLFSQHQYRHFKSRRHANFSNDDKRTLLFRHIGIPILTFVVGTIKTEFYIFIMFCYFVRFLIPIPEYQDVAQETICEMMVMW